MDMIEKIAEGQANFDGRKLSEMPKGERERYRARARLAMDDLIELIRENPHNFRSIEARTVFNENAGLFVPENDGLSNVITFAAWLIEHRMQNDGKEGDA